MDIEYDAAKDEINRFKHRLPLAFGGRVFEDDDHVTVSSFRPIDGEDRHKAIGMIDGKLYTAVHVWRDDVLRLISVRRSNDSERKYYDSNSSGPE
ncbi:MAG: BrnT family toxin [Sphingomonadaceae bacterium]